MAARVAVRVVTLAACLVVAGHAISLQAGEPATPPASAGKGPRIALRSARFVLHTDLSRPDAEQTLERMETALKAAATVLETRAPRADRLLRGRGSGELARFGPAPSFGASLGGRGWGRHDQRVHRGRARDAHPRDGLRGSAAGRRGTRSDPRLLLPDVRRSGAGLVQGGHGPVGVPKRRVGRRSRLSRGTGPACWKKARPPRCKKSFRRADSRSNCTTRSEPC